MYQDSKFLMDFNACLKSEESQCKKSNVRHSNKLLCFNGFNLHSKINTKTNKFKYAPSNDQDIIHYKHW